MKSGCLGSRFCKKELWKTEGKAILETDDKRRGGIGDGIDKGRCGHGMVSAQRPDGILCAGRAGKR